MIDVALYLAPDKQINRLCQKWKLPRPFVIGLIQTIVMKCIEAGTDRLGSAKEVEEIAEWPGRPGAFFRHFEEEWLVELDDSYYLKSYGHWACFKVQGGKEPTDQQMNELATALNVTDGLAMIVLTALVRKKGIEIVRLAAMQTLVRGDDVVKVLERLIP